MLSLENQARGKKKQKKNQDIFCCEKLKTHLELNTNEMEILSLT